MNSLFETGVESSATPQHIMEVQNIVDAICNLSTIEMSYSQHAEMAPMADELVHYLSESLDGAIHL